MDGFDVKLSWRDVLAYFLAYGLWIALNGIFIVTLFLLRSVFPPVFTVLLARNPYYIGHTVELRGIVNSIYRLVLIGSAIIWVIFLIWTEEYFRTAVAKARERRQRARMTAEDEPLPVETGLRLWSLDLLPRRVAITAIFPASVLVLYLLLEGLFRVLVHG